MILPKYWTDVHCAVSFMSVTLCYIKVFVQDLFVKCPVVVWGKNCTVRIVRSFCLLKEQMLPQYRYAFGTWRQTGNLCAKNNKKDPLWYTPWQRGNYHHRMFHNPTAAVNLFHVRKQYLAFCKAKAAVTHDLIGRKIISNVKHSDARNSLPILDVIHSSHKRHSASEYCKWTLGQTAGVCDTRIYVLGAPSHFPTEYRHEAAVVSGEHMMKWVVILGDCYQWPLPWECIVMALRNRRHVK